MMPRAWLKDPGMRTALGALVIAAAVMLWTLVGALRVEAVPDVQPAAIASLASANKTATQGRVDIASAVDNDLFAEDRSAPTAPYRMPGEPDPNEKPAAQPQKPVLLGTIIGTDNRSYATVQLGGDHPTLVHVGDKIGDWTVKSIERGKITLVTGSGSRADVTMPKPGT